MFTYEFSTTIAEDGTIVMPADYAAQLPKGEPVRIIVFVNEHKMPKNAPSDMGETMRSLEELVAQIKSTPSNPANIRPGNMGRLAECLANPLSEADPDFDEVAWNQQWAQIEAEMDALEQAKSAQRLHDLLKTMSLP